jgi:hypothetical protein
VCFKLSSSGVLIGETEVKLLSVENGGFLFRLVKGCDLYTMKVEERLNIGSQIVE